MAAAQAKFAEKAREMDEKRRRDLLHLESCFKQEIEKSNEAEAQLAATRNDAGERPCDLTSWLKAPFAKALCEVAALGSAPLPDDYGRPSERARDF